MKFSWDGIFIVCWKLSIVWNLVFSIPNLFLTAILPLTTTTFRQWLFTEMTL